MRSVALAVLLAACGGSPSAPATIDAPDPAADAASDAPGLFGMVGGMCGAITSAELAAGSAPGFFRDSFTFTRAYDDATDRAQLTSDGQRLAAIPNAGGSSGLSELFAFEQLARCEHATFLKSETQIVYDQQGKKTDILVEIGGIKIGVSVVRTFGYPLGTPYTLEQAKTLIGRKLDDINISSTLVSAADKWQKQFLSVLAWDDATVETVFAAWQSFTAERKADTELLVIATHGEDVFIYDE